MFGSIFCNVENFFFISLAIIFILVLLLVYLFKQRISTVEKTGNTMFDMVSRLTDEVKWLKGFSKEEEKCAIGADPVVVSKSVPERQVDMGLPKNPVDPGSDVVSDVVRDTIQFEIVEPVHSSGPVSNSNRIVVEDLGESDSDDDESVDSDDSDESVDSDDESDDEESLVDISLDLSLDLEVDQSPVQIRIDSSSDVSSELGEEVEITVDDINEIEYKEAEVLTLTPRPVISTLDSDQVPLDDQFKPVPLDKAVPLDDLKKMDVRQLRQLAFQKTGQDMSKTKKNELVRMLTVSVSLE